MSTPAGELPAVGVKDQCEVHVEQPHGRDRLLLFLNKPSKRHTAFHKETPHLRPGDEELIRQGCLLPRPLSTDTVRALREQLPGAHMLTGGFRDDQISISNDTWHFLLAPLQDPTPPQEAAHSFSYFLNNHAFKKTAMYRGHPQHDRHHHKFRVLPAQHGPLGTVTIPRAPLLSRTCP